MAGLLGVTVTCSWSPGAIAQPLMPLAVVVSEETGRISVAHSGRLVENLDQERLRRALRSLLRLDRTDQRQRRSTAGAVLRRNGRARAEGSEARTATAASTAAESKGSVSWELESDS